MGVTTFSSDVFPEEGVRGIKVEFKDDSGVAVVPNASTIKWSLTNIPDRGTVPTVINSREDVIVTSASTIYITLEGDDLALLTAEANASQVKRLLTLQWEYNSTLLGNNREDKSQLIFCIENLYKIG